MAAQQAMLDVWSSSPVLHNKKLSSVMRSVAFEQQMETTTGHRRVHLELSGPNPLDILRWQKADGSFEPCAELLEFIGLDEDEANRILDARPDVAARDATEAALRWMKAQPTKDRRLLGNAIVKAGAWMKKHQK